MNSWPWTWWSETDESWLLLIFTLWGIFTVTWYAWLYVKASKNPIPQLPPGPLGLPVFGNLLSLNPELHSYFTGLAHTYGPIFKLRLGTKMCIVVNTPSFAREILKDYDVTFANRDVSIAAHAASYGGSDIVWSPHGPEWRMLRKICTLKMLGNNALDSVRAIRHSQVRKTVKYLYSRVGSPVNVGEQIFVTILNIITIMIWGGDIVGEEGDERVRLVAEFRKVILEMIELMGQPNISDFYPRLGWFDFQGIKKEMDEKTQRLDHIFQQLIDQRLRIQDSGSNESQDFFTSLLKTKHEGTDSKTPLSMDHVKALLMNMMFGGTDTTSNTIEFAITEAMRNPAVMDKAQQELEAVVGKHNIVQESHIPKLPYLQAIMKETLRLYPIVPLLVPHCPSETCTIGGYTIPKGSQVFVNAWGIHRDPSNWENPLKFDPNRFLDSRWDNSGTDFKYLPFGAGRRICPGTMMAEKVVVSLLATLLHSFDWKLPQGEKLDLSENFGIVLKKKMPLVVIPTLRLLDPALYH